MLLLLYSCEGQAAMIDQYADNAAIQESHVCMHGGRASGLQVIMRELTRDSQWALISSFVFCELQKVYCVFSQIKNSVGDHKHEKRWKQRHEKERGHYWKDPELKFMRGQRCW